jgi:hypothetical protein
MSTPPRNPSKRVGPVTDPAELASIAEEHRRSRQTALGQMGCCLVVEAPLPLLAQYVVELPADERQEFLDALVARLPAEVLRPLAEALRTRMDAPAA